MYGDVETLLTGWLEGVVAAGVTVVVTSDEPDDGLPVDLTYRLPLVGVARVGGADDTVTLDRATVDIDCFAADYGHARDLALDLWARVRRDLPGYTSGTSTVARTRITAAPVRRPWDAPSIYRVGMTVEITAHVRIGAAA